MEGIKKNENFFVEGSGKAVITGDNGKLSLIHLQDMQLDLSSKMEDIFGGEGNFSIYSYQSEKSAKATFTNASMSLEAFNLTQGTTQDKEATLFADEDVTVGAGGELPVAHADKADKTTFIVSDAAGNVLPVVGGKVEGNHAGETVNVFYTYTASVNAVGSSVLTTSVPGYVAIYHRSKPLKQKNGRIVRILTTIFKARSDGSMKIDFKHKNAFAPQLTFNAVDPERADKKFMSFTVQDVTEEEKGNL